MIKIPSDTKRFSIPGSSDVFGNIHYTKSINLDEEGYIKLSPRAVALLSSSDDTDFNIPVAFGRRTSGQFYVATTEAPFEIQIAESAVSATQDTDSDDDSPPNLSFDSHGIWWQNRWHVTENQDLVYKTVSNSNWTDAKTAFLTSGKVHQMDVFRNRNTIAITDGNVIEQLDTSYADSVDLTLPADFEAVAIKYNNHKVGIATRVADTVSGQGGEAYFFVWDGATTSANGGYAVGSDAVVGLTAYKSSWVLLTRTGNLLYFNGGGFEVLASLPHYYMDRTWGDSVNSQAFGDIMTVDGDVIYFQVNGSVESYGTKSEVYTPSAPGGVLCYDPKVGIYHKYAPSVSKVSLLTVSSANVNTTTSVLTTTTGTIPTTGNPVKYIYNKVTQIGGLNTGQVYYVIYASATTFQVALTPEDAAAGTAVSITSTGDTNNYFLALDVVDYGASKMERTGAVGLTETNTHALNRLVFGGEYYPKDSGSDLEYLDFLCTGFKNIGYFVTARASSADIEDQFQKVFVKYRPLKEGDQITVKAKTRDVLGLPMSTPQGGQGCLWASTTELTTASDLSEVVTYLALSEANECEVEIISGAGAGQCLQITSDSIYETNGTYVITFDEAVDGAALNNISNIVIENWKVVGTITDADTDGHKEIPLGSSSKSLKLKVVLEGDDVAIEELNIINQPHQLAQ
jgi:hypothetical protein